MNRKSFLTYFGLIGVGLSFAGRGMAALEGSYQRFFLLPKAKEHVRHGLFQLTEAENPLLPSWFKLYAPHRFFRNGFEKSDQDMMFHSFHAAGVDINIGVAQNAYVSFDDDMHSLNDHENRVRTYQKGPLKATLLNGKADFNWNSKKESIVVVLKGHLRTDQGVHTEGECIHLGEHSGTISSLSHDCLALHLSLS